MYIIKVHTFGFQHSTNHVVEGTAFLGNANTFAFESFQGSYAVSVVVSSNNQCRRGVTFLFTTFVCNDGEFLSACCHIKKAGSNTGSTYIYLRRSSCNCNGMSCVEPLRFNLEVFFSKEAFIHSDKKRCATC